MSGDIIYVCHSTNQKNVRGNELNILRHESGKLYFEFGENEMNVKKRYYNDEKTLLKDFEALQNLKEEKNTRNNASRKPVSKYNFDNKIEEE